MAGITIERISEIAARRPVSYEEFLRWDGENRHVEWENGQVVPMSPVSARHQQIVLFLLRLISEFVERGNLGVVQFDPFQMKTGPGLPGRAPDILFVAADRAHRVKPTFLDGPADLVVEVVSPDDPSRDRVRKFAEYQEGGVREYWLIDPEGGQADFYVRDGADLFHRAELGMSGEFASRVLPGLRIETAWLASSPLPSVSSIVRTWNHE